MIDESKPIKYEMRQIEQPFNEITLSCLNHTVHLKSFDENMARLYEMALNGIFHMRGIENGKMGEDENEK